MMAKLSAEYKVLQLKIKENGWRQGSILPDNFITHLHTTGYLPSSTFNDEGFLFVISQDCDICGIRFDIDPNVELIFSRKINTTINNANKWGKNPRVYHMMMNESDVHEITQEHRFFIPRSFLDRFKPDLSLIISDRNLEEIKNWMAGRYIRTALPDEFNERLKPVRNELKKIAKQPGAAFINNIYLSLSHYNELRSDQIYNVWVICSIHADNYEIGDNLTEAEKITGEFQVAISSCEGIDVVESHTLSEEEISIASLYDFRKFDVYNYLTTKEDS